MDIARMWRQQPSNLRLVGSRCRACGEVAFPARRRCPSCRSPETEDHPFRGKGRLVAHTVVYEPPRGFGSQVPYIAGLVRLDEGPVVSAMITDIDPEAARCGLRVEMVTRRIRCMGADAPIVYGYKFAPDGSDEHDIE